MRYFGLLKYSGFIIVYSLLIIFLTGCNNESAKEFSTHITIIGDKWYFNDRIINEGSPAEGLLMNVRMVNTLFEDRSGQLNKVVPDFDPVTSTKVFTGIIPEYVSNGINAFTISLQGGNPGYEGAINTAFNPDGSLRESYMERAEKVIRACDANNAAVNLSLFYQRQHSHQKALTGKESIINAVENTAGWIAEKGFTNVILEISNEYRHSGFRRWVDGDWLTSEDGQAELIRRAKNRNPDLLVSTSGMGDGRFHETLAREADFILIHFNHTWLDEIPSRIKDLKKYGKPILCNEDEKLGREAAVSQALSVLNGSGWGFMYLRKNQWAPFIFSGADDDPEVYGMYRNITSPGYQIDHEALVKPYIYMGYPGQGDVFLMGQPVYIKLYHLFPDRATNHNIKLLVNDEYVTRVDDELKLYWNPETHGIYELEAVVNDQDGNELYRSPKTAIFVHRDRR